jgi:hypothetical protein
MIRCPLSTFVDFACCTGARKVAIVRDLKAARGFDFYAPITAAIRNMHALDGVATDADATLLTGVIVRAVTKDIESDRRKASIYPKLIASYVKLLGELGPTTWAPAEATTLPVGGDLELTVEPELGLVLGKTKVTHLLSLYMHGEILAEQKATLTAYLMRMALGAAHPVALTGVVDVMRPRLVVPTATPEQTADMRALVRAEAASFEKLWGLV